MNFEFKMVSLGNVVFIDCCVMDVAFLILLTCWHTCIALTFAGNTCLMKFSVCICIGFLEFNKPAMCKISHSHFFSIILFVLPFQTEHSTYFILSKVSYFVGRLKHKK